MRYKQHGTAIAIAVMLGVLALTLLASPAAALNEDLNASSDNLPSELDANVSIDTAAGSSGNLTVRLADTANVDEGDFEIQSAKVNRTTGGLNAPGDISETITQGETFKTYDDTVLLENVSDSDAGQDVLYLEVTIDVLDNNGDLAQSTDVFAGENTDDRILEIGDETTMAVSATGSALADLDIVPGDADNAIVSSAPTSQINSGATTSFDVQIRDAQNNVLDDANTRNGIAGVPSSVVDYSEFDVSAAFVATDGTAFTSAFNQSGKVPNATFNFSSAGDNVKTFNIDHGDAADQVNDLQLGYYDIEIRNSLDGSGSAEDTTQIDITPDDLSATTKDADEITAGGSTNLNINVSASTGVDGSSDVNNVSVELSDLQSGSNYLNLTNENIVGSNTGTILGITQEEYSPSISSNDATNFTGVDLDPVDRSGTAITADGVDFYLNVVEGAPAAYQIQDPGEIPYATNLDKTVTVDIVDDQGNVVPAGQYDDTETEVILNTSDDSIRNTGTFTHVGNSDTFDINDTDDGGIVDPAIGTFDITVRQTGDSVLASDTVENVDIYPGLIVDSGNQFSNINSSDANTTQLQVNLTTTDDYSTLVTEDEADIQFDSLNLDFEVNTSSNSNTAVQSHQSVSSFINGTDTTSDTLTVSSDTSVVTFDSNHAGQYAFNETEIMPNEVSADQNIRNANVSQVTVHATEVSSITLDTNNVLDEVQGTVDNDGVSYTDVNLTAQDAQDNYVDYTTGNENFVNISVQVDNVSDSGAQQIEVINETKPGQGFEGNVEDANGSITLANPVDPASNITNDMVGDTTYNASATNGVHDTVDVTLSHEVKDLQEGYQPISVPQSATLNYQNVNDLTFYNNTGSSAGYDLTDSNMSDTEKLHYGHYINGINDNARVGFEFETVGESQANVDSVALQDGWNLVATNVNVSAGANPGSTELEEDLLSIQEIDANPSTTPYVLDGNQTGGTLNASDGGNTLSDLSGGSYGAYWVKTDNASDDLSSEGTNRDVINPAYKP